MRKSLVLLAAVLLLASPVRAEEAAPAPVPPPVADPVTLTLPRATLIAIGQGVMKLPYDVAAPILNTLNGQLVAADRAAAEKKP